MTKAMNQTGWWLTGALALAVLAGCGGGGRYPGKKYDLGRILTGTVTFEGKPLERAGINLQSQSKGFRSGPIEKGKYIVDNLETGKYTISFEGAPQVDAGYSVDDPKLLTIEISEEMKQERNFELHVKKRGK